MRLEHKPYPEFKQGDRFIVLDARSTFVKGSIVTLHANDNTTLPLFRGKIVGSEKEEYFYESWNYLGTLIKNKGGELL